MTCIWRSIFKLWYILFEIPSLDRKNRVFKKVPDSASYCPHQMLPVGYKNSNSYVACGFSVVLNTYVENHHNECYCSMGNIPYSYSRDRVLKISASKFAILTAFFHGIPQCLKVHARTLNRSQFRAPLLPFTSFPIHFFTTLCSIKYWQHL